MKDTVGHQRYPLISKHVSSVIGVLTSPLVEGSFNLMDDVMEKDRSSMNIETYESISIIKSVLKVNINKRKIILK